MKYSKRPFWIDLLLKYAFQVSELLKWQERKHLISNFIAYKAYEIKIIIRKKSSLFK